jgi:hypothetical protein
MILLLRIARADAVVVGDAVVVLTAWRFNTQM